MNEQDGPLDGSDKIQKATEDVVNYIVSALDDTMIFSHLVDTVIGINPDMLAVQKLYFERLKAVSTDHDQTVSGRNELYQQIETLYNQIWESAEKEAMKYIVAQMVVQVYG